MAFPILRSGSGLGWGDSGMLSENIPLPAGTQIGDIVFLWLRYNGSSTTVMAPNGWNVANKGLQSFLISKRLVSGDNTSTVLITLGATRGVAILAFSLGNAEDIFESSLSGSLTPPNLSPGVGVKDFKWFALASILQTSNSWVSPSGYSGLQQQTSSSGSTQVKVVSSYKDNRASSESPGAYSITSGGGLSVATLTIGISGLETINTGVFRRALMR